MLSDVGFYGEPADIANLAKKLSVVMGEVTRISKQGYNSFHKYNYATADDVVDELRPLLAKEGIALIAEIVDSERAADITYLKMTFTFVDSDTGALKVCKWESEASDKGDKGLNKAATAGEKYWLIKTFLLSTGEEDADATSSSNDEKATDAHKDRFFGHMQQQLGYTKEESKQILASKQIKIEEATLGQLRDVMRSTPKK